MPHLNDRVSRRLSRVLALTPVVLLPLVAAPALAVPPEQWPEAEPVSALDFLMVLLLVPLALTIVIALFTYVPTFVKGDRYTPGRSWRSENEWFGGPQAGLEAADRTDPKQIEDEKSDRGGASARW
jgi:hypothetical protein